MIETKKEKLTILVIFLVKLFSSWVEVSTYSKLKENCKYYVTTLLPSAVYRAVILTTLSCITVSWLL